MHNADTDLLQDLPADLAAELQKKRERRLAQQQKLADVAAARDNLPRLREELAALEGPLELEAYDQAICKAADTVADAEGAMAEAERSVAALRAKIQAALAGPLEKLSDARSTLAKARTARDAAEQEAQRARNARRNELAEQVKQAGILCRTNVPAPLAEFERWLGEQIDHQVGTCGARPYQTPNTTECQVCRQPEGYSPDDRLTNCERRARDAAYGTVVDARQAADELGLALLNDDDPALLAEIERLKATVKAWRHPAGYLRHTIEELQVSFDRKIFVRRDVVSGVAETVEEAEARLQVQRQRAHRGTGRGAEQLV